MKKLILIQNDYTGAGKTTLAQSMHQYLENHRVPHHSVLLTETLDDTRTVAQIEAADLSLPVFIAALDSSDLVLMEIETGFAAHFNKFFEKQELADLLPELGFELTIAVPVTGEEESYEGVINAAESFSDCAQYLIVHTPSSSCYDEDENNWEHCYAARVMDMFEAIDVTMPPTSELLEAQFAMLHTDLAAVITGFEADEMLKPEIARWHRRVAVQLDGVRKYAFGDAFRPGIYVAPPVDEPRKARKPRAKKAQAEIAV